MDKNITNNYDNHKLLIMTVYAPSEYNEHWYRLQKHFIQKNTLIPYDFKIIVNDVHRNLFEENEIVKINDHNIGHPAAIEQILTYMREHNNYNHYLILDSDCFPVRAGWHKILDKQMKQFDKSIAAPIRYENLDIFPHPCVVYINKEEISNNNINFNYAKIKNLLGDEIDEVGGLMTRVASNVFPLLRTNRLNIHPVASGIYHHLFYHHGAGSRGFEFRILKKYGLYDHWIPMKEQENFGERIMSALIRNPEDFIDRLMYGD